MADNRTIPEMISDLQRSVDLLLFGVAAAVVGVAAVLVSLLRR